jgi:hypothetical protein
MQLSKGVQVMSELNSLTLNGKLYDSFPDRTAREALEDKQPKGNYIKSVNGRMPDGNGDIDLSESMYDLKEGYGYTPDVCIAEDGTQLAVPGKFYKCLDFIPVRKGVSYTMYGCGYALYDGDKNFLSAVYEDTGINRIREFTPEENGFVRLTINCDDLAYARFCRTDEKYLEPSDYSPKTSPFFDPKIPCNVHLYGDSTSEGYGLDDPSKSWANRLGALITSMTPGVYNRRFAAFADKADGDMSYILHDTGYLRFTAYTNFFGIIAANVGEIAVYIDGQRQDSIVQSGNKAISFSEYGSHTIELYGVSGTNTVSSVATRKQRTFENHAVHGSIADAYLPEVPVGNVAIVMYGTNDRQISAGYFYRVINDFVRRCKAYDVIPYVFTPIPVPPEMETGSVYKQSNNDIISQLPVGCFNIYKDMQLAELLCGRELYINEGEARGHYNELGQAFLYVVAASKLQLAPPMSELVPYFQSPGDGSIDLTGYATIEYVDTAVSNLNNIKYVEVTMNDGYAYLVDESVKSVFTAVDAGNTVILFRDSEDGVRIYYRLYERSHDDDGAETLTFTHKSIELEQYIHLTKGGPLDGGHGAIGVGTAILSADDVGAIPAPVTAEIGQAMCVSEVDENGKPTQWEPVDLSAGGSSYILPVATQNTLGGVKPVTKSDDMTQSVGVDADGGLWTVTGDNMSNQWRLLVDETTTEDVESLVFSFDEVKEIVVKFFCKLTENTDTSYKTVFYLNGKNCGEFAYASNNYKGHFLHMVYTGTTGGTHGSHSINGASIHDHSTSRTYTPVSSNATLSGITDTGVSALKICQYKEDSGGYRAGARLIVIGR